MCAPLPPSATRKTNWRCGQGTTFIHHVCGDIAQVWSCSLIEFAWYLGPIVLVSTHEQISSGANRTSVCVRNQCTETPIQHANNHKGTTPKGRHEDVLPTRSDPIFVVFSGGPATPHAVVWPWIKTTLRQDSFFQRSALVGGGSARTSKRKGVLIGTIDPLPIPAYPCLVVPHPPLRLSPLGPLSRCISLQFYAE